MHPGKPVFWLYKAQTFSAKVSAMRFSRNSKKWVSGLLGACLALPLVGCSPEASTTATKPAATSTGASKPPKEQTGSALSGASAEKGREVPEPNPADASTDEKRADEKPKEE
jgi:hypothetical protein